jgi:hypothetical protein
MNSLVYAAPFARESKTLRDVAFAAMRYVLTIYVMALMNDLADARGTLLSANAVILPDIGHDFVPFWPDLGWLADLMLVLLYLLVLANSCLLPRRFELICAFIDMHVLLMLFRCMTVSLTTLPSPVQRCDIMLKTKPLPLFINPLVHIFSAGGMQAWCHDLVFSGHSIVYTLAPLFLFDANVHALLRLAGFLMSSVGIMSLLASRLHYSLDIFLAALITALVYLQFRSELLINLREREALRIGQSDVDIDETSDESACDEAPSPPAGVSRRPTAAAAVGV